jgi:hypothetical protein
MVDRRPEDARAARTGQEDLTQRINAAYASSGPVQADGSETAGTPARPTGKERVAAVLARSDAAKAKSKDKKASAAATPKRVRKAHLRITHVDPWSVMKTSFLFSVAIGIVVVVAVGIVWGVLGAAGIWDSIDKTVADVVGETGEDFRIEDYLGASRVMGFTMIIAVVDVVLVTVIGTLGAFLYNLAAALLGGIEVVLAEDER